MLVKKLEEIEKLEDRKEFVLKHKEELIKEKKSILQTVGFSGKLLSNDDKTIEKKKMGQTTDSLKIKAVGNLYNYIDNSNDIITSYTFKKTINERKSVIPFLKNHNHTFDSVLGQMLDIRSESISTKFGNVEALVFEAEVMKAYDEKVFEMYRKNQINQHSVGFQIIKIDLAINDQAHEKEFSNWERYNHGILNQEKLKDGFFWVIMEAKLYEISAVLFGDNDQTFTLEIEDNEDENIEDEMKPQQKMLDLKKMFIG